MIMIAASIASIPFSINAGEKLSGTPIASYKANASKAFDGNTNTFYTSTSSSYAWVGLDLGEQYIIDKVKWVAGTNTIRTQLGVFQGANNEDFSDAVSLTIIGETPGTKPTLLEKTVDCSRGFRYVRYVGPSNSYAEIAELEFYGTKGEGNDSHLPQLTNLPTITINTVNNELPYDKENYISSTFILVSDNGTKVLQQAKTGIRLRGNASINFPKKPYKIKFDKKQNVLDAPAKAKKWTLINNYGDKTLMRNKLAFDVARKMGMEYVPYCAFVDVVVNGEYEGCYQLCDQVEVNDNRVEIEEMSPEDISGDALTGGYLVEVDGYAESEPKWFMTNHYSIPITIKSPDEDEIVDAQFNYIKDYFNYVLDESMIYNTDPNTGYRTVFDTESFIQHMLVNEVAGNTDCYWSTYMYKRRNDPKIYTGPVWDFDLGFNNDWRSYPITENSGDYFFWDSGKTSGAGGMTYLAQRVLRKDVSTAAEIKEVWKAARNSGLSSDWLKEKVDEYASVLDASQKLNFMRWRILNEKVHENPFAYGTYAKEVENVKNYIGPQMDHLDKVVGYNPEVDSVNNVEIDDSNASVEYFTLTGLKVKYPSQPGIYIMKKGNDSSKILIK